MREPVTFVVLLLAFSVTHALPTCNSLGAGWTEYYYTNHDTNSNGFSGGTVLTDSGPINQYYGGINKDFTWSATGVPYHTQAYVAYELLIAGGAGNWDGEPGDTVRITWNGAVTMHSSFAYGGSSTQCYPQPTGCSSTNAAETGAANTSPLSDVPGTQYDIIHGPDAHTANTLSFRVESLTSCDCETGNLDEFRVCLYDPCLTMTCTGADANACEVDACENGVCVINDATDGENCAANGNSDNCEVTQGTCSGGTCTYADASDGTSCATLGSPGACEVAAGTCSGGTCTHFAVEGTNCDDGDFCNGVDTCNGAGSCVGGSVVECTQDGQTCQPSTGTCVTLTNPTTDDGSDNDSDDNNDSDGDDGASSGNLGALLGGLGGVCAIVGLVGFAIVRRKSDDDEEAGLVAKKGKAKGGAGKAALAGRKISPTKGGSNSPAKKRSNSVQKPTRKASTGGASARNGRTSTQRTNSANRLRKGSTGGAAARGGRSASQGRLARKNSNPAPSGSAQRGRRLANFVSSLDFLASDGGSSMVGDSDLDADGLKTKEAARQRFVKLLTHKDLHMVVALIDATPMMWAEVTCRTIVAAFVANKQVVYLLRSLVTREITYADNPSDAFKATSRAAKCFTAFAKVAGGAFLREALGKPLEAAVTGELELDPTDTKTVERWSKVFLDGVTQSGGSIPQEFQRVLNVLAESAKEKWTEDKTRELIAGFLFVRLLCPAIAFPSASGLADQSLINSKIQDSLVLISKVIQKLAMGVKFSVKDGDLQKVNPWLDTNKPAMSKFIDSIAKTKANKRQTMMELPKWGEESEASRFSIMSSASALMSQSYLGAAADGIVVPQDIDALVSTALNNEEKFLDALENGRDAAPEAFTSRVRALLKRFKELKTQA